MFRTFFAYDKVHSIFFMNGKHETKNMKKNRFKSDKIGKHDFLIEIIFLNLNKKIRGRLFLMKNINN